MCLCCHLNLELVCVQRISLYHRVYGVIAFQGYFDAADKGYTKSLRHTSKTNKGITEAHFQN